MDLKFWKKALREAERERDAATTRTALDAAAKETDAGQGRAEALQAEVSAQFSVDRAPPAGGGTARWASASRTPLGLRHELPYSITAKRLPSLLLLPHLAPLPPPKGIRRLCTGCPCHWS